MKVKDLLNLAGAFVGIVMIIFGVIFIATPADSYSTKTTDYASFGADFYTYEYDATRAAATNAAVTANNLRELGEKVALYAGFAFIFSGLFAVLHFAKQLAEVDFVAALGLKKKEAAPVFAQPVVAVAASAVAPETVEEAAPAAEQPAEAAEEAAPVAE